MDNVAGDRGTANSKSTTLVKAAWFALMRGYNQVEKKWVWHWANDKTITSVEYNNWNEGAVS